MILSQIIIENYKSIQEVTIPIKKYGSSYMTTFVGLNEAGKTNILDAISCLCEQKIGARCNYDDVINKTSQNNKQAETIQPTVKYEYTFENDNEWHNKFKENFTIPKECELNYIKIDKWEKKYYVSNDSIIHEKISFHINDSNKDFHIEDYSYLTNSQTPSKKFITAINKTSELTAAQTNYVKLDIDKFTELINKVLFPMKQITSIWKAEDKYLISNPIPLPTFANNPVTSIPLQNLFSLIGTKKKEEIIKAINAPSDRIKTLEKKLSKRATEYIHNVWKEEPIGINIDIDNNKTLTLYIQDQDDDECFYHMNERSQGFKQFISLILSLSIPNKNSEYKDQIILIDEPENHLHPSGIRYMKEELLKIGKNNYLLVATHSPFLIDKTEMERHFIVSKNSGITSIKQSNQEDMNFDDEVLKPAFGINVFKDLLAPNKILVEGYSDFKIIRKAFLLLDKSSHYGITNGQGGNIVSTASLCKLEGLDCLTIVDDDSEGQGYKKRISELGNIEVKTLRDLNSNLVDGATIEDTLNPEFVTKVINDNITTDKKLPIFKQSQELGPIIKELKAFLYQNKINQNEIGKLMKRIKTQIGEKFNPSDLNKNPQLKALVENIIKYFENKNEKGS